MTLGVCGVKVHISLSLSLSLCLALSLSLSLSLGLARPYRASLCKVSSSRVSGGGVERLFFGFRAHGCRVAVALVSTHGSGFKPKVRSLPLLSAQGGPKDLKGKWDGDGILFADGNKWSFG